MGGDGSRLVLEAPHRQARVQSLVAKYDGAANPRIPCRLSGTRESDCAVVGNLEVGPVIAIARFVPIA